MYWVMSILPFALLLLGFPIFLLLLATSLIILTFFFSVPMTIVHQAIFNSLNKFPLLAVPFFIFAGDLMSRGGISKRLLRWVASLVGRLPRPYSADLARIRRAVRRDLGRDNGRHGGGRHADLSEDARGRLQRALRRGADHRGRRARQSHSAVDRHDHLRHRLRHLGHPAFRRRHRAGPAAGRAVRLPTFITTRCAQASPNPAASRSRNSCTRASTACGRWARSSSSSAASIRASSRRPRRPASPASMPSS